MNREITITELAKRAGVSETTVMNVLNGRRHKMRQDTYERVQSVIQATGYVRRVAPSLLSKESSKLVAVMIKDDCKFDERILSTLMFAEKQLFENRYFLLIHIYSEIDEIIYYSRIWQLEGVLLFDEKVYKTLDVSDKCKISIANIVLDTKMSDQINDFIKELLALSRKCGKI